MKEMEIPLFTNLKRSDQNNFDSSLIRLNHHLIIQYLQLHKIMATIIWWSFFNPILCISWMSERNPALYWWRLSIRLKDNDELRTTTHSSHTHFHFVILDSHLCETKLHPSHPSAAISYFVGFNILRPS